MAAVLHMERDEFYPPTHESHFARFVAGEVDGLLAPRPEIQGPTDKAP